MNLDVHGRLGVAQAFLRSLEGQFTAGATAMATLTWLLWPSSRWTLQPEPMIAFGLALVAWLISLSRGTSPLPSSHDRLLLQKVGEALAHNVTFFLRMHDFGTSFRWAMLEPLYEVAHRWIGADYAFDDPKLDADFTALRQELDKFLRKVADEAYGIAGTDKMSIVPDDERATDWFGKDTFRRVETMNEAATAIADRIDNFIKGARRRVGPNAPTT